MDRPLKNYNDLLKLLEQDNNLQKDVYSELIEKEHNVLEVSNRIANQKHESDAISNMFLNISLSNIIARFGFTWQNIFEELIVDRDYKSIVSILFKQDRKIYVGMMVILIAIFIYMANI